MRDTATIEKFSENDMDAALCIWEFSLMNQHMNQDHVFDWLRGGEGAASARQQCIELAKDCDRSYQIANKLGYDSCFDWEFIPSWVLTAIEITEECQLTPEWVDFIGRKIYYEFRLEHERLPG